MGRPAGRPAAYVADPEMMRTIRLAAYFLVGLLLSAVSVLSYAETIPATSQPYSTQPVLKWLAGASQGATPVSACQSALGAQYGSSVRLSAGAYYCMDKDGSQQTTAYKSCPASYSASYSGFEAVTTCYQAGVSYSCPTGQNWTLSGSNCTRPDCIAPQVRDSSTGLCTAPPCPDGQSMLNGVCVSDTCPNGSPRASNGLCRGAACSAAYGSTTPPGMDYSYQTVCQSQGCKLSSWVNSTGSVTVGSSGECTPGTNLDPLPCSAGMTMQTIGSTTKCYPSDGSTCAGKGQCSGSVNGVTVCTACAPGTTTTKATASSASTTTTPLGGPATTTTTTGNTTTSVTTNADGSTTVTTTTETTKPDGTVESKTETASEASFCVAHPTDPICTKKSVCEEHPDRLECKDLGTPTEEGALTNKTQGVTSITSVSLATNETCPADISLPKNMHFSWQPICNSMSMLKPLVLALAWLTASMIVIGAAKNG